MLRTIALGGALGGLMLAFTSPCALAQSASAPHRANPELPSASRSEQTLTFTDRRRHVILLLEDLELGPLGNGAADCSGEAPFELIFGCRTDDRDFDPGLRHYMPQ